MTVHTGAKRGYSGRGNITGNQGTTKIKMELLTRTLSRTNLKAAYENVTRNKGSCGVDGITIVIPRKDCTFIKSTYLDNIRFLPKEMVIEIDNLKNVDENYWRIYGLGEIGQIKGLDFTNWEPVDAFPEGCKWITYGMDFGFTNDPTVIMKVGMFGGEIYVDELLYNRGMTNKDIIQALTDLKIGKGDDIIADNQPQSIYEIRQAGFNIKPAFKGPESILTRIDIMKRFRIKITRRSINLIRELKNYKWKEDVAGNLVNQPVERFNHAVDAVRYVCIDRKLAERRILRICKI